MKSKLTRLLLIFLCITAITSVFGIQASALSWNGTTTGGGGGGTAAKVNGYAVRTTDDNCIGYRFSLVNKSGSNKVSTVIDVFRNTTYGNYEYTNGYKFSSKYNKKQLINNQNGNFSTASTTSNCYKEADMGFASALPVPGSIGTWQKNNTNLNKVLAKLNAGSISNLKNGDKILVEPLYDVKLEKTYHAVTVTELAIYGKHLLGANSDGGSSSNAASWGFISAYTNRHYPNSLYTTDGMGLWTNASALSKRATFYTMINTGYGVGIAYNETKSDFSPALSVVKCEGWPGTLSTRNSNHYGISTGSTFANWSYGHGYPSSGSTIWYAVDFPAETENCYVKQSVWVDGGGSTSRNVYSSSGTWYDVSLNPTTINSDKSYIYVKARVDWIESNGTVKKYGTEKTFYIPIAPKLSNDGATVYDATGTWQAQAYKTGYSGGVYVGQSIKSYYNFSTENSWASSDHLRGQMYRWNGSDWVLTYNGEELYYDSISLSKTSTFSRVGVGSPYTVAEKSGTGGNYDLLMYRLRSYWATDINHALWSYHYIPIYVPDVELYDIRLVNDAGYYVDKSDLTVGEHLTVHYVYKNNTDCQVFIKGYNDDKSQIDGIYCIPAKDIIEVAGYDFYVPNERIFSIWGGVYLSTVSRGDTHYESDGTNNSWSAICRSNHPLTLTPIAPNSTYREKTNVISSFWLNNASGDNYTPDANVSVRFRVYKSDGSLITTQTKQVIVPRKDKNLIYFKWYVPQGMNGASVTVQADILDSGTYYNLISNNRATTPFVYYNTPDTHYEESAPSGFRIPTVPTVNNGFASWWEYRYENNSFVKQTYGIGIYEGGTHELAPNTDKTSVKSGSDWEMKSGYGVSLLSCSCMTGISGYSSPDYTAYTVPQYAYALLPEYNYEVTPGKVVTLDTTVISSYVHWKFPAFKDYGDTHFVPLWYPNGNYTVQVISSDAWTPAGMISSTFVLDNLKINGNMYDDWYNAVRS